MGGESAVHVPVMLPQVLAALGPVDGEVYVDGTFGAGGYSMAFLKAAHCSVIAIDRDSAAQARARALEDKFGKRFIFRRGCFGDAQSLVRYAGFDAVDGFVLDLGVSSPQLDEAQRGFSFRFDGPLDMRMDTESDMTAADIVNTYDEEDLANLIYEYGQERHSRRVARAIVKARAEKPIDTTFVLAEIVRSVVRRSGADGIDPATRTFQALRIAVNRELDELSAALEGAEALLREGGRLVVVSFHSLEDTIVKRFLQERAGKSAGPSRHLPVAAGQEREATFVLQSSRAITPDEDEARKNPRARSAKLRTAIRTAAPPFDNRGANL